jgi:hypothetical protein
MYLTRPRSKKPRVLYNDDTAFEALSAETSLCAGERCRDRPDERRQGELAAEKYQRDLARTLDIHGENIPLLHTFSSPSCAGLWEESMRPKIKITRQAFPAIMLACLCPASYYIKEHRICNPIRACCPPYPGIQSMIACHPHEALSLFSRA